MGDERRRKAAHDILNNLLTVAQKHPRELIPYDTAVALSKQAEVALQKAEKAHEKIFDLCADDAAAEVQNTQWNLIIGTFIKIDAILGKIIREQGDSSRNKDSKSVSLPLLNLPCFDGNSRNWQSFKDLFTANIGNHANLSSAQKFQYLKSSVINEAAALISSLSITDSNYQEAWRILDERFDNKREIVHKTLKRMLITKTVTQEKASDLQNLVDLFTTSLSSLKSLQSNGVDLWDSFLVVLILEKLDPATRRQWAINQTGTKVPTYKEVITFLTNHIRGLQESDSSTKVFPKQAPSVRQLKANHASTERNCAFCNQNHLHHLCKLFISKPVHERKALITKHKLCFNCLNRGHSVQECKSTRTCKSCNKKHHTLLHMERPDFPNQTKPHENIDHLISPPNQSQRDISSCHASTNSQVLLATTLVRVLDSSGGYHICRAFLDTGSEGTFVTEELVKRLGLKRERSHITVKGVSSATIGTTKGKVQMELSNHLKHNNSLSLSISAHILRKVTDNLPKYAAVQTQFAHLSGLQLADPDYHSPSPVDILIGAEYVADILLDGMRKGPTHLPVAQETIFGWILYGRSPIARTQTLTTFHSSLDLDHYLPRFWTMEELPTRRIFTSEEKECEKQFSNTVSVSNGFYVVKIPFNEKIKNLGYSRDMALQRFRQVERRLVKHPHFKKQYQDFMKEYEDLGHMTRLDSSNEIIGKTFYLPHHFVTNEASSTTKLRVVFDGSAKSSTGISLNDAMPSGPTIQDDLYSILLRFRLHAIAIKSDVRKMFRNFRLTEEDSHLHRIVWRPTPQEQLQDYRLTTVTYGTKMATFLATRCLQQLADEFEHLFPEASKIVKRDMYVDDLLSGGESETEAVELYKSVTHLFKLRNMQLGKWASSNQQVLSQIPESQREMEPHEFTEDKTLKALGIQWNPSTDRFVFKKSSISNTLSLTKRVLLSELSKVFDPVGFVSCVIIVAKLMMQELWSLQLDWDERVPQTIADRWKEYQDDLQSLNQITIPRRITVNGGKYQLHGFADASERAYGAVIYLRTQAPNGEICVHFVTSKTRVAPLKQHSLPRLELNAAVVLAELVSEVMAILKLPAEVCCWTDSTITLHWIKSESRRWQTYVANRVAKIQELTLVENWRHVAGTENPADLASRGTSVSNLLTSELWWCGPWWLQETDLSSRNEITEQFHFNPDLLEEKRAINSHHSTATNNFDFILERFSSLTRLKRVTAILLRWNPTQPRPINIRNRPLSPIELEEASNIWIKYVQTLFFSSEISNLQVKKSLPNNSSLKSLSPFLDRNGILRVGGRLANAPIPDAQKHQIILPAKGHFTTLIVRAFHKTTLHGGFQLTWAAIQTLFWIHRGRKIARHIIRKCVICRRHKAIVSEQLMGNLPSPRVSPNRPFLCTGVDYAGPFTLKNPVHSGGRNQKTYKAYLCIFVCLSIKAVHMELVSSLSTEAFIAALRRFVARRGLCRHIFSDNGTNFVGAEKEIEALISQREFQGAISSQLATDNIQFHFNPPHAPHRGGLWESAIKSAKQHIRRIMGSSILTYEQFSTFLTQVEAVLNSRPLYDVAGPEDGDILTPAHFLIGESLLAVPDVNLQEINTNRLSIYQQQQQRLQIFWKKWSTEYINTLQQRNKWYVEKGNIAINDLILLKEDTPPTQWKLGRVVAVYPSSDGLIRTVTIKTATGLLDRPIQRSDPCPFPYLCVTHGRYPNL